MDEKMGGKKKAPGEITIDIWLTIDIDIPHSEDGKPPKVTFNVKGPKKKAG